MANYPWFITSPGWGWAHDGAQIQRVPTRESHAKALGQSRTACGLECAAWTRFWHLPYQPGRVGRSCADCDAVLRVRPKAPVGARPRV
ncbi:hypothetical protein [Nocardioides nitrophenolicus]|uniref:hypothetical protein n=1 Tax=Nocardioides nitrophenolicus TaxID=60489 RepID=UPI00195E4466|nr:hypothetical protein [Nocardioides nitrophenolicus]MBM7517194.1 hypothetical protein [Nocardioides nitrophenolicus]